MPTVCILVEPKYMNKKINKKTVCVIEFIYVYELCTLREMQFSHFPGPLVEFYTSVKNKNACGQSVCICYVGRTANLPHLIKLIECKRKGHEQAVENVKIEHLTNSALKPVLAVCPSCHALIVRHALQESNYLQQNFRCSSQ